MCLINFLYNFPEDMRCFTWFGAICAIKKREIPWRKIAKSNTPLRVFSRF